MRGYSEIWHRGFVFVVSGLFGGSLVFLFYVLFLQSAVFSPKRMAVLLAIFFLSTVIYYLAFTRIFGGRSYGTTTNLQMMLFWLFIPTLLAPSFFPVVDYPISPLFQSESLIRIIIQVSGDSQRGEIKSVWLDTGDVKYNRRDFQVSGDWIEGDHSLLLTPGGSGELVWGGKVGEKSVLAIGRLNANGTITVLWDDEELITELTEETFYYVKRFATPFWFRVSIAVAMVICLGCILFIVTGLCFGKLRLPDNLFYLGLVCLVVYFSVITVRAQLQAIAAGAGFEGTLASNQAILNGTALNPVQYRIFTPWLIEWLMLLAARLRYSITYYQLFVFLRIAQNLLIFGLAYLYFRKLNFPGLLSGFGIILLAGSILNTTYQSDFAFHTYFDLTFYLFAAVLLLSGIYFWLPVLVVFASFNRETSGVIPFLSMSVALEEGTFLRKRSGLIYSTLAFIAWCAVFIALHLIYRPRALFIPYGRPPGISLLLYNLSASSAYVLFSTLGFAPFLGLISFKKWIAVLKRFFIILVPLWFAVHLVGSVVSETRLFLVPQALIFIPTLLIFVREVWCSVSQHFMEEGA